jgi:hypothetical protein
VLLLLVLMMLWLLYVWLPLLLPERPSWLLLCALHAELRHSAG